MIAGQGKPKDVLIDGFMSGLRSNWHYRVDGLICPPNIIDPITEEPVKLVRVRDMSARGGWIGAWGSQSQEYKKYCEDLKYYM